MSISTSKMAFTPKFSIIQYLNPAENFNSIFPNTEVASEVLVQAIKVCPTLQTQEIMLTHSAERPEGEIYPDLDIMNIGEI